MAVLDEDAIDEILYLARANEVADLESYLSETATRTKQLKPGILVTAIDKYTKNSALHYAAANGHHDVIRLLISSTADRPVPAFINAINDAGNTSLHWAALNGHLECVKLLVQSGADVTIINKAGHDAVFEAEINDKNEVVDWLLGAVEELENGIGQTGEEFSRDGTDEDMEDVDDDTAETVSGGSTAAGTSVEDVRKQMEAMEATEAKDAPVQGGG